VFPLKTKTLPILDDKGTTIPVPTLRHHVARAAYKVLLAVLALAAVNALVRTADTSVVFGVVMLSLPLPVILYIEYLIRRVTSWNESTQVRRGMLFVAELGLPLTTMLALVSMPGLLQAYGFSPSPQTLALVDVAFMFVVGLGGPLANVVWSKYHLGFAD
jgi:hypothetical protein